MHNLARSCLSWQLKMSIRNKGLPWLSYNNHRLLQAQQTSQEQTTTLASANFSTWLPLRPYVKGNPTVTLKQVQHNSLSNISRTDVVRHSSNVPLTRERYQSHVKRGPFAVLSDLDISSFEKILPGRVVTDRDELLYSNTDWLKTVRGESRVLLKPKTTEEVSAIVKYCSDRNLAINPQGGNTGMVGGSVPVFDEVIISTQLMNKVISLDTVSGILVCQSGCILDNLYKHVEEHGLTMPVDLGARGSCHIGGNVATNAGGIHVLRYGSLHGSVLGIEAVLPDGQILDCLSTLRKDNTGYDLKQLFIGSEGTLGIITGVSILCPQQPQAVSVGYLACESFSQILEVFKACRAHLGEVLSAFEFMDSQSLALIKENMNIENPLPEYPFYVLVECSGSNGRHDEEKLMSLLQLVIDDNIAVDGTIATDLTKVKNIWRLREACPEALMFDGYCYKYDISLPLSVFYQLVEDMRARLKDRVIRVVAYGHVGDGNLHLNITAKEYNEETMALIEPFIYDWVAKYRGSVSAEHGLGFKKKNFIYHSKTPTAVALMALIKKTVDPKGIMNPYKLFPDELRT
ncbi:unnamed protein product [Candidula unifasciata]|uniref:D-2-hydroxyglutarate dehydrogenase, mitochondrial n=1 Tax=Candidula unifasciata TaxID=100452 RepID=A0A8S4A449_9EUPU|nr:unnamed protein product [Candidula unifasciata]